jgi:hypothetical protein
MRISAERFRCGAARGILGRIESLKGGRMITPSGVECAFYYEDFSRGQHDQGCRIFYAPPSARWDPRDCAHCQVPRVLVANGSPHLVLRLIRQGIIGGGWRLRLEASCALHGPITVDPRIGCPACNEEADAILREALG